MKPFNLELAKAGHPVCTRDGHKARIVCFDKKGCLQIVALIQRDDGNEYVSIYDVTGRDVASDGSLDLMMASEKREGWINIYKTEGGLLYTGGGIHTTKEESKRQHQQDILVDTIKIEWEE